MAGNDEQASEARFEIRPLTGDTWDAFAALVERHNGGGFGGCWCCWFHNATMAEKREAGGGDWRAYKQRLVREGGAHAALAFDGDNAVAGHSSAARRNCPASSTARRSNCPATPGPTTG